MKKKVMKIGVLSKEDYQKRTHAIAKGEHKFRKGEPKIFFESMKSLGQVLSVQNQELLRLIKDNHPNPLSEPKG